MTIQEELKQQAVDLGLCKQWQQEWGEPTISELCDKYIRGLDFCIKHDYPSLEYLEQHFKGKVEQYGIYINEDGVSTNQKDVVINGNSNVRIYTDSVCDVTIRHNSIAKINVSGNGFVYVSMHDNSRLIIESKSPNSKICVSLFGGEIINPQLVDRIHEKKID